MSAQDLILDVDNRCLWAGSRRVKLTPKTFRMLEYFRERPNQLISKDELLAAVWGGRRVEEAQVRQFINELRRVLSDDADAPRYVQTEHGYGYRFVGSLALRGELDTFGPLTRTKASSARPQLPTLGATAAGIIIGRETELSTLRLSLDRARRGESVVTFVSGELGIGKSTLVSHFLSEAASTGDVGVLQGQCSDGFQNMEPYWPVLDALDQWVDTTSDTQGLELLRCVAPTWLLQMTGRIDTEERARLLSGTQGTSPEHRIREIRRLLDTLAKMQTTVLCLEDVHWADLSTIALLNELARSRRRSRVMVLCTLRPVETQLRTHPLLQALSELRLLDQCVELPLKPLSKQAVTEYFNIRSPQLHTGWASVVYERTEGNPLFMAKLIDELECDEQASAGVSPQEQARTQLPVPSSLRALIEQQFSRLEESLQPVLLGAAIAGARFSAALAAAALEHDVEFTEQRCESLAERGHFIRRVGVCEWPDGTVAAQYEFAHVFYLEVFYDKVTPSLRAKLHLNIGRRLEAAYQQQTYLVAAELSWHFERGRDPQALMRHMTQASLYAFRRCGFREAYALSNRALRLLSSLPSSREQECSELALRLIHAHAARYVDDVPTSAVGHDYERARELCSKVESPELRVSALWGLVSYHTNYGDQRTARIFGENLLLESDKSGNDVVVAAAHAALATVHFHLGEFALADEHAQKGLRGYKLDQYGALTNLASIDLGIQCRATRCLSHWIRGHEQEALGEMNDLLSVAEQLDHPYTMAFALHRAAKLHQFRGDAPQADQFANQAIALSQQHGFAVIEAVSRLLRGWAVAAQGQYDEGIDEIKRNLSLYHGRGAKIGRPWHQSLLAQALSGAGLWSEARSALAVGLEAAKSSSDCVVEAVLYRLKGECLIKEHGSRHAEAAEECLARAMDIACRQGAWQWERRATIDMAALWVQQGKHHAARELLRAHPGIKTPVDTLSTPQSNGGGQVNKVLSTGKARSRDHSFHEAR